MSPKRTLRFELDDAGREALQEVTLETVERLRRVGAEARKRAREERATDGTAVTVTIRLSSPTV